MNRTKPRGAATTVGLHFLLVVIALAISASSTLAQSATGQIVGKVTDPNGAVVSGATVTAKSLDTGRETSATSDDQGGYTITALQPGLYDVTVQSGSFKPRSIRIGPSQD